MDDYRNPLPGQTYISRSLDAFDSPGKKIRIATKLFKHDGAYAFAMQKGELILRYKEDAKTTVTAKFFEDSRGIFVLNIQGYTAATSKPHNASFSFLGSEINALSEFLNTIRSLPLKTAGTVVVADEYLQKIKLSPTQARSLVQDNEELFAEMLRSEITKEDLVAVGYRKKQLQTFERLLNDPEYFSTSQQTMNGPEAVWQNFFEANPWIFGYGLSYIPLSGWNEKKLEQVVQGHSIAGPGKRTDALLRTRGLISSLCFVEIKTHTTPLLKRPAYRSGCWAASEHLAGGIAQVHGTVAAAVEDIRSKLRVSDASGIPTGEEAYNYQPRSFLVIGNLAEFDTEHGINEQQFRSFELLRKNSLNPEIITFDELFERAKFIVSQSHG